MLIIGQNNDLHEISSLVFAQNEEKVLHNLLSAAFVIGALRIKLACASHLMLTLIPLLFLSQIFICFLRLLHIIKLTSNWVFS